MKILILGATGSTGRHLVLQALQLGYQVTAFARCPSALENKHERLQVVHGDVLDPASLNVAIAGQDAVVCALGTGRNAGTTVSTGVGNTIKAMNTYGVRRLVFLSALGAGDSKSQAGLAGWLLNILLKEMYKDKARQEELIKRADLDWVIVHPPRLTEGSAKGHLRVSVDGSRVGWSITRADLAAFMLAQVSDDSYLHKTPAVSN